LRHLARYPPTIDAIIESAISVSVCGPIVVTRRRANHRTRSLGFVARLVRSTRANGPPGGSYAKAQPRERGAGTDAEGRFSSPVFRPLSTSVLAAFGAPVLRAVNCWPRAARAEAAQTI
jgi:hypothetical protein